MNSSHQFLTLPESLFETSAVADFAGDLAIEDVVMGADVYYFADPVHYQLFITNTGGALLVTGKVTGAATTACARCLDSMELPLDAEIEAYYVLPGADEALSEDEEVEYETLEGSDKIDLTTLIRAALALAFPYIPLCDEECAGLCPQCGVNLNHETCDCTAEEPDMSNNPFAVLKDYQFGSDRSAADSTAKNNE